MTNFRINGVDVRFQNFPEGSIAASEPQHYVEYVRARVSQPLDHIDVSLNADGTVDVRYETKKIKFERIRRITGYLTGDVNSWNDAKRAEVRDRVKHDYGSTV